MKYDCAVPTLMRDLRIEEKQPCSHHYHHPSFSLSFLSTKSISSIILTVVIILRLIWFPLPKHQYVWLMNSGKSWCGRATSSAPPGKSLYWSKTISFLCQSQPDDKDDDMMMRMFRYKHHCHCNKKQLHNNLLIIIFNLFLLSKVCYIKNVFVDCKSQPCQHFWYSFTINADESRTRICSLHQYSAYYDNHYKSWFDDDNDDAGDKIW